MYITVNYDEDGNRTVDIKMSTAQAADKFGIDASKHSKEELRRKVKSKMIAGQNVKNVEIY